MVHSSDEREEAIRELFPLVNRLAKRLHRMVPSREVDDLVGDGCIGAIKAVDRFDASRNVPLPQYAVRVIVGAMLNGMRDMDTVPERVRRELRQADAERYAIAAGGNGFPTSAEMERRRPHLRRARSVAAQYTPLSLDCKLPLGEHLECDWSGDPARIVETSTECDRLRAAVAALPQRQRFVITMHYSQQYSLTRIGRAMNVSPQRSSQIHLAAMRRLRTLLHAAP